MAETVDSQIKNLRHIAFIMDGNGRWAKKRLLPRSAGHKAGVKRIKEIITSCYDDYGIYCATLFTFSTENWNRPQDEIDTLFQLLKLFFTQEIDYFMKRGTRIKVLGDLSDKRIPQDVLDVINDSVNRTAHNDKNVFNVLFNYGGRYDILNATKKLCSLAKAGKIDPSKITEKDFENELLTEDLSDVDLLVRTSGEERISNCLLYQIAYSEFVFTNTFWPDFDKKELGRCIDEYKHRNRRFGTIK
ncbi:MAG: polyprenyl diphosphate synthase [Bacilli bacterium]